MFSYVLLVFLIYLVYRFIVGFVLPILTASKKLREKMQDMNQQYPPGYTDGTDSATKKPGNKSSGAAASKPSGKDYIEFEEIK
ncbi:MAG: hypothetical protein LH478_03040 [Chitinophagaceae bacterium]|nr:hypothetical protein [Chitinophagaceae bacterium]